MRNYLVALLLLLSLTAFQCNQDILPENGNLISVAYSETQCADPWMRGDTDQQTLRNIDAFMRERGIRFTGTEIIPAEENLIVCLACICTSGRTIVGNVHKDDLRKIEQYGFARRR